MAPWCARVVGPLRGFRGRGPLGFDPLSPPPRPPRHPSSWCAGRDADDEPDGGRRDSEALHDAPQLPQARPLHARRAGALPEDARRRRPGPRLRDRPQLPCGGRRASDCHINIEYLNLNTTKLLIENENRPIIIHLLSPKTTLPSPSSISTGSIQLNGSSQLCGVNTGKSDCNNKPEHLIITNGPNDGDYQNGCASELGKLSFGGQNLPAAIITLQSGTVGINNDASMRGLVWAQNICGNNNNLTIDSANVVQDTEKAWKWRENNLWGGNGRQTIRGIRGSGMDLFEKF